MTVSSKELKKSGDFPTEKYESRNERWGEEKLTFTYKVVLKISSFCSIHRKLFDVT